jgi:hypothetical protein
MHPLQQIYRHTTEGASMSKEDAIRLIKLLSAMESWSFSLKQNIPDYLHEDLHRSMEVLERVVLEKPQENYTYGTPLLDAFTKERQA